jgi:hypothetical protein
VQKQATPGELVPQGIKHVPWGGDGDGDGDETRIIVYRVAHDEIRVGSGENA